MPKSITMPDGAVINFPDNMDDATIHAEGLKYMQQKGAKPQDPIRAAIDKASNTPTMGPLNDKGIDYLRPVAASTVGAAASAIPLPGTGPAAYVGTDMLLQSLKRQHGSVPEMAADTGIQAILGKIIGTALKLPAAVRNSGMPDPEILKYSPTYSQGIEATEGKTVLSKITKWFEDNFATGSKNAAIDASGQKVVEQGNKLAGQISGRSAEDVANPQKMVRLISGDLVPESSVQDIKIKPKTADVQPIKIDPNKVDYQPVEFTQRTAQVQPIKINETQTPLGKTNIKLKNRSVEITGAEKEVPIPNSYEVRPSGVTQQVKDGTFSTKVTGPVEQVKVPGAYEVLPGKVVETPFATDPASLDKLIAQPERLQKALSDSQSAGMGINVKQDLAGYRLSRVLQDATTPEGRVDVTKLRNAFNAPEMIESNKILFNSQARSNIEQFFKNAEMVQGKVNTSPLARRITYVNDGIALPYALFSGNPLKIGITGGIAALQLTGAALAKAFTNPSSARVLIRLAGAEPLGMSDAFAGRILTQSLNGVVLNVLNSDGEKIPAKVQDGAFVPLKQ